MSKEKKQRRSQMPVIKPDLHPKADVKKLEDLVTCICELIEGESFEQTSIRQLRKLNVEFHDNGDIALVMHRAAEGSMGISFMASDILEASGSRTFNTPPVQMSEQPVVLDALLEGTKDEISSDEDSNV